MSRIGSLKPPAPLSAAPPPPPVDMLSAAAKPARQNRAGKKMVGGNFSGELSRAVNILAAEQGTTVQALVGEALDLLPRHYGKHPMGER